MLRLLEGLYALLSTLIWCLASASWDCSVLITVSLSLRKKHRLNLQMWWVGATRQSAVELQKALLRKAVHHSTALNELLLQM